MIRFVHAADLHLDAPFASLPAEQAQRRREEQREALERLADLVLDERADLVLLSGDRRDGARAYRETAEALSRALARMAVPVFIAPGNHDPYTARSLYASVVFPENVRIFRTADVETVSLPALGCTVSGAAFTSPVCDFSPLRDFTAPAGISFGVFHADVDGTGRYADLTREEIASTALTYLALGHVHRGSGLQRAGNTVWAYPGCMEGRGFDELGDKGVLVGEVDEDRTVSLRFVPLARRRYRILPVDLTDSTDPSVTLAAALPRDGAEDLCRIILTGEVGDAPDLTALTALARPFFYQVSLRDATSVRRDLWERAGENSLTGLFLREMRARLDASETDEAREALSLAVRFGLAALEKGEDLRP